jgi:hypothetical protein
MADEKKYTAKEAAQAVLKKAEEMLKAHKSKHEHIGWNKLHGKLEHEGYSKESADKIAGSIKAKVEKSEEDRSKMSGKSGLVRMSTESNQNQTGVGQHGHKGSSGGISEAGAYHRDAMHSGGSAQAKNKAATKEIHQKTLSDLKSMPKPALTKKEEPKGEIHPKEHIEGEADAPGKRIEEQQDPEMNPKEQAEGNNEEAGTTPTQVGEDEKNKPGYDEMKGRIKLVHFMDLMKQKRGKKVEAPRG